MNLTGKRRGSRAMSITWLVIFCLCTLVPFTIVIFTSVRTTADITREGSIALPSIWHFDNYLKAWNSANFSGYFLNSVIIAVVTVCGTLLLCMLLAYALVYMRFKGKGIINTMIVMGLIIPFEIIMIPLFYDLQDMGLMSTHAAIFLPQIALGLAFGTFLLRGFMKDIPKEMIESSRMDGASELRTMFQIIGPMLYPALVTLLIFTFMSSWNSYMLPNIMTRSESLRTLPLGLDAFKGKFTTNIPLTCAASNIMMLPVLVVYFVFQKKMIQGMTIGAVKG